MGDKKRVLILDPPDRRVIPTVGSLGKEYDFHFLIPIRKGFGCRKAVEMAVRLCKPRNTRSISFLPFSSEDELIRGIANCLRRNRVDALLPFSERSTAIALSLKPITCEKTIIPFGCLEDFLLLNDKFLVTKIAREQSIPTPDFRLIENEVELEKAVDLGFPIVLKCCRASGVNQAMRICHNYEELKKARKELLNSKGSYSFFDCDKLVAQEFINGKIYDGCFAVDKGKIVASMSQMRNWTIPLGGGVGAYNITIAVPEIIEYGKRLFERVAWTGPAQMEFILDEKTKEYKLIEVNPRFWGTLGLSVKAGINFPKYVLVTGFKGAVRQIPQVKDGIEFKWLLQETLAAEILMGKGRGTVFKHLLKILSSEINNFSYSILSNLVIAAHFIIPAMKENQTSWLSGGGESLASRLFL